MNKFLSNIKLFAFDLDGTLYVGENCISGASELIEFLKKRYQLVFFTNNSSKTKTEIHEKLNRLGLVCKIDEVYASSTATAVYLKEAGIDNIYVIGSCGFRKELEIHKLQIIDDETADNLVVGHDFEINYSKITIALSILLNGGKFIVCNEDGYFPVGKNSFKPGCGAMVGAIVGASGKKPDFVVGKPNTYILSKIAKAYGVKNHEIMVIGDSYKSDIQMALNYNSKSILITTEKNITNKNVLRIDSIHKLLNYVQEG